MSTKKIVFAVLIAMALTSCSRTAASYVAKGNKFAAQGKYDDAIIQYRNAVQKDPKYADAYYRAGLVDLHQRKFASAYDSLRRAVELEPDFRLATQQFGDLAWLIYRAENRSVPRLYSDLSKVSQRLLSSNPRDFDGLRFKAYLAIVDKRVDDALGLLEMANSVQPLNTEVVMPMAQLLIDKGDLASGEKWLRQLVDHQPSYGSAYDALYLLYMREKRVSDAEAVARLRVEKNPLDTAGVIRLAGHYSEQGNTAAMNKALEKLRDGRSSMPDARMALGEFYALHKDPDDSLRTFQQAIQEDPKNEIAYRKKIVTVQLSQGKRDQAEANLDEILKRDPNDSEARGLKAGFDLTTQQQGKVADAVNIYKDLSSKQPNNADLRFYYARSLLASGDARAARSELSAAIQRNPNSVGPKLALAQLSVNEGQFNEALQLTTSVLDQSSSNGAARLLRAIALAGLGQRPNARADLTKLLREFPGNEDAELQLALLDVADKRYDEATKTFSKYYHPGQTDQRPLEGLVRSDVAQRQFEKAMALLEAEIQKSPNSNSLRLMLAAVATSAGKPAVAEAQYQAMAAQSPNSSSIQLEWADLLHSKGDFPNALEHYKKAKALDPKNSIAAALLGRELSNAGQVPEAIASYRDALKANPNNVFALNNLAFLLAESGQNLDDALQMALSAQKLARNNSALADTLGWVYFKKGLTSSALQIFQNNVRKDPKNPTYRYHLGAALLASGDKIRAKEELQKALQSGPSRSQEPAIRQMLTKLS
jgi:tetratricopeptide (TPR) repeat protein